MTIVNYNLDTMEENSSGQGKNAVIPKEIDQWSWGAFFLNAIWGAGNKTYVALLAIIPFINIIMMIVLGLNGNKWAWRNKRWESVEHFEKVQKRWAAAGFLALGFYLYFLVKGIMSL